MLLDNNDADALVAVSEVGGRCGHQEANGSRSKITGDESLKQVFGALD